MFHGSERAVKWFFESDFDVWDRSIPFEYEHGRIQITVPKELIGIEAKVHIEFPNAPEIKERHRRGRKVFDYFRL